MGVIGKNDVPPLRFSKITYVPVALSCVFCEINIAALDYFVCSTKMLSPAVNHLYLALIFAMPLW